MVNKEWIDLRRREFFASIQRQKPIASKRVNLSSRRVPPRFHRGLPLSLLGVKALPNLGRDEGERREPPRE